MWHSTKQILGLCIPEARQEDPCYSVGGREVKWAIELVGQKDREQERHVIISQDA